MCWTLKVLGRWKNNSRLAMILVLCQCLACYRVGVFHLQIESALSNICRRLLVNLIAVSAYCLESMSSYARRITPACIDVLISRRFGGLELYESDRQMQQATKYIGFWSLEVKEQWRESGKIMDRCSETWLADKGYQESLWWVVYPLAKSTVPESWIT